MSYVRPLLVHSGHWVDRGWLTAFDLKRTFPVSRRKPLRITLAMAADVSDRLWTLEELVEQPSR